MLDILKFKPILKTLVWGGSRIASFKEIKTSQEKIGESWEISAVEGSESVVSGGPLEGLSISELMRRYKGKLAGESVCRQNGDVFPLLLKFIDARSDLSIQVHPDDALAAARHCGAKGKTEMWYVVDASDGAAVISGLSRSITPQEYRKRVSDGSITEVLEKHAVRPGDVFFLPAGRIHAICGGCFIAEIQETSDITYRIFDYNRPGLDGKPRQLHTELAAEAIDYKVYPDYRTRYETSPDHKTELVTCPYFTTELLEIDRPYEADLSARDSFTAVMCLEGRGKLCRDGGREVPVKRGETVLVPAEAVSLQICPDEKMKLLGCFVPCK